MPPPFLPKSVLKALEAKEKGAGWGRAGPLPLGRHPQDGQTQTFMLAEHGS